MPSTIAAVDIGTSSAKLLLVDADSGRRIRCQRRQLEGKEQPADGRYELRPLSVLQTVRALFADAGEEAGAVTELLLCGQMHGIVLWRSDNRQLCTNCVTWQDGRCDQEFLLSLPPVSNSDVVQPKTGFGLATLLWWRRHSPELVDRYDRCGSILDWLASALGGADAAMSTQMAASWGYFDLERLAWDTEALAKAGLGDSGVRLPAIVAPGTVVATVGDVADSSVAVAGLGAGCRVRAALGDLQCAVYAACRRARLSDATAAFANFGTSAQLGFVADSRRLCWREATAEHAGLECFPYFCAGRRVLLAASLNGGHVLAAFVRLLVHWAGQIGAGQVREDDVWQRLQDLADDVGEAGNWPTVLPRLFGERHQPDELGSVLNISPSNCCHLGVVYSSLCRGLVANLLSMCPVGLLQRAGVESVALAGGQLLRNRTLLLACQQMLAPLSCRQADDNADAVDGLLAHFHDSCGLSADTPADGTADTPADGTADTPADATADTPADVPPC